VSSHARKKSPVIRSRKPQPDPYTSRILKTPSKRELDASLRHAVRNRDFDALEDFDEAQLRPPTNAVKDEPVKTLEDLLGDSYDPFDARDLQDDLMDWDDDYDGWPYDAD